MTHTPPVPAGNQSPYPLQTPPLHAAKSDAPPPGDPRIVSTPKSVTTAAPGPGIIAVAAGLGLAALAGGLFVAFRGRPVPKPAPKPRAKRKPRKPVQA